MVQSFLGTETNTEVKGSVAFQDGISSAKQQQDAEVEAETEVGIAHGATVPQTDYSISALTGGKVTASPGTQEYRNQMNAHMTQTLQADLTNFTYLSRQKQTLELPLLMTERFCLLA